MISTFAIGFYVKDEVGQFGIVAGPFKTPADAREAQLDFDIRDDCGVWHRDKNGRLYPYPGYSPLAD